MFNSLDVLDDLVPVSELSNGRTSAVLNKADRAPVIIINRNKPTYVLMGINDYQDLLDRLEDTEDVRLAEKRIEDNNGRATIPNADLMAELGLTEEDIAGTPPPEMAGAGAAPPAAMCSTVSGPNQPANRLSAPFIKLSTRAAPWAASRLPKIIMMAASNTSVPRRQVTNAPNSFSASLPCVRLAKTNARLVT